MLQKEIKFYSAYVTMRNMEWKMKKSVNIYI